MRSPVVDLLADAAAALREATVPWYLFGAQAAILHGAARLTADVDVTVRLPSTVTAAALVSAVIAAQGPRFDPGYVRDTLGSLEGALGQADLLPAFESALRRANSVRNE